MRPMMVIVTPLPSDVALPAYLLPLTATTKGDCELYSDHSHQHYK
jgi:hypothetical protein